MELVGGRLRSELLGVDLEPEGERLWLVDLASGKRLPSHETSMEGWEKAEHRADAEAAARAEAQRRSEEAQRRAEAEAAARREERQRADAEAAGRLKAETEIERLRR